MSENQESQDNTAKFTWARAFRDIAINAMNTGQFPFFCMFIIALIILFRVDPQTLDSILLDVFNNIKEYVITGYVLLLFTIVGVTIYIKALNKRHNKQVNERNKIIESLKDDLNKALNSPQKGEIQ